MRTCVALCSKNGSSVVQREYIDYDRVVSKFVIVWYTSHRDYRNKIKKNCAWESVATTLDIPKKDVKGKIHNIRSQFLRKRKKLRAQNLLEVEVASPLHKSNWFAYDSLLFPVKG